MPTGAELFVQTLQSLGIGEIFTLVGDHLNEVLAVAQREGMRIVDMRHESGVTHAADAWARIHRRPAVSLVTGGPGHTNSLTGIATANLACSPLIAVSGSRASTVAERGAFQDIDQVSMTRGMVKWAGEPPSASQVPFYLGRAYQEANSGRRGAVHLTIPLNVFLEQTSAPARIPQLSASVPSRPDVRELVRLMRQAERPVVIAGSGIWWAGAADELRQWIELTSLPLFTVTMAKGCVPDTHPLCLGYADPAMNYAVRTAFKEADLVVVLGKRLDYRLALAGPRLFAPDARFAQVDVHATELGLNRNLEVAIQADVKQTLLALMDESSRHRWAPLPWLNRLRELKQDHSQRLALAAADAGSPLHPAAFHARLRECLPPDVLFAWDGGDFTHWGRATIPASEPGGWLRLGPLGTIGSALPNAIALKLAHPERPVVMLTGDGSLGFYLAEMDTAVRYKLPFVIIVGNDAGWGLERELQSATVAGSPNIACELAPTRYDLIMKGFGGDGETIERLDEVAPAMARAFASPVPYCVNVRIRGMRSPFTEWQIAGKK
jgi:acetolactate synthase-1/2/3 large subunit